MHEPQRAIAPAPLPSHGYRRDIDGLRTVAVLPVVFGHAGLPGFSGGFVGVDVFFVISGFLITGILAREIAAGHFSLLGFYERRARRILPALLLVLAAVLGAGCLVLLPWELAGLARSAIATLLFASNVWFLRETGDYFGTAAEFEPLLHTWSLAVEEQFYLVFPLLLYGLARLAAHTTVARVAAHITVAAVAALVLASFALAVWATGTYPLSTFFLIPTRLWELGLGALLALGAFGRPGSQRTAELLAAAGLLAIAASVVWMSDATPFPGLAALPPCLGACAIIWAGTSRTTAVGRLLSTGPMVGIGLVSYSLYLWHWPPLAFARILTGAPDLAPGLALGLVALAGLAAWLSWRFVERPFRRPAAAGGVPQGRVFAAAGLASAALGLVCLGLVATGGWASRMAPEIGRAYAEATAYGALERACRRGTEPCLVADAGDPDATPEILLWGDSHAAAAIAGFEDWLARKGRVGAAAVKPGCPPLLDLVRADLGERHGCDDFNRGVLAYAGAHDSIETVVLMSRWALAAHGTRAPGEPGGTAVLAVSDRSGAPLPEPGNAAAFAFGFDRTVEALAALGKTVIVIDSIPEIGFDVPQGLARHRFLGIGLKAPPDLAAYTRRTDLPRALMTEAMIGRPARLEKVADLFCPDRCAIERDGRPLYRDDDHLSVWGATLLFSETFPSGRLPPGEGRDTARLGLD